MRYSHYRTPRSLAECQWVQGYASARPARPASWRETLAGAALSAAIFAALAAVMFFGWSA